MKTLEQIVRQLAALPDPQDLPLSTTRRQAADEAEKRRLLECRITAARAAASTLAKVDPQIALLVKWRDHLTIWRKVLCDQLAALLPARTSLELGKHQVIELSITRIDRGLDLGPDGCHYGNLPIDDLMREAGYVPRDLVARANGEAWLGSAPDVERRLRDLQRRHDQAQAVLAEVLQTDAERERRATERTARAASASRLPA